MDNLKTQLKLQNFNWAEPFKGFNEIAKNLMFNYIIKKGKTRFAIIEIEFYLYSDKHQDYITYPRNIDAGNWFFHSSGVDLTFQSKGISLKYHDGKEQYTLQKDASFGGILIRGLYNLNSKENNNENDKYIFGPQKCVNLLWDNFNAFESSNEEYPVLIPATKEDEISKSKFVWCKRCINIEDKNKLDKITKWSKRLGKADISDKELEKYKEEMFDNSDTQLYRFFNLQTDEDPRKFTKIPAKSRPKEIKPI